MMKFSCEKAVLQAAVAAAAKTVSQKSSIAVLEGILLKAGQDRVRATGYNLETAIVAAFDATIFQEGEVVLNARLFSDIVRRLPDEFISFACDEKFLCTITCGKAVFHIMSMPPAEFPEIPEVSFEKGFSIPQSDLKMMIGKTLFSVAEGGSRPIHTGALFETADDTFNVVALDGFRLALASKKLENKADDSLSFVVPGAALREVERLCAEEGEASITLGGRHIMFSLGDTVLVSRILEGEFINYQNVIPSDPSFVIRVNKKSFQNAVERASIMISERLKSPVRLVFKENEIEISSSTAIGRANEAIESQGMAEGLEIGFNNRYIIDAVRAIDDEEILIELTSPVSPCVIRPAESGSGTYTYMILPVRLSANG